MHERLTLDELFASGCIGGFGFASERGIIGRFVWLSIHMFFCRNIYIHDPIYIFTTRRTGAEPDPDGSGIMFD